MNELLTAELIGDMVAALALLTGGLADSAIGDRWSVQMPDERFVELYMVGDDTCGVIAWTPAGFTEWTERHDDTNGLRGAMARAVKYLTA